MLNSKRKLNSNRPSQQAAQAVVWLAAQPQWKELKTFLMERLEACRDKLEIVPDPKFDQGAAAELRFILELEDTAQAVLSGRRPPSETPYD